MVLPVKRRLRYALETALVYSIYGFFRIMPMDTASDLGGWIFRNLGPRLPSSDTARRNLALAFPERTESEREKIVEGVWDNLGRVIGEYSHLHRIWSRVELIGGEHLTAARDSGKAAIFYAGHLANWELNAISAKQNGVDIHLVYRKPNNPGVDSLLRHARNSGAAGHIEKGAGGAREIMSVLRNKGVLGMLIDQKLNEGLPIPFFGRDAMTADAIAHFALRYDCPVYPSRVERLGGCRFRITIHPALEITRSGDKAQDVRKILTDINQTLENWIRERPEQWLWIHRRWPD